MCVARLIGLLLLFACGAAQAQTGAGLPVASSRYSADLLQLYQEAQQADPRLLTARARALVGDERQREAFGALLPQISANSSMNRTLRDDELTRELYNNERYALGLSQHVYNKSVWENYQKYKELALQSEFDAVAAHDEAAIDLAQRYFVALASDDELALVSAERRTVAKNLERTIALLARQRATMPQRLELQARVDVLAAQEIEARNQVRLSREELAELIGRPVTEPLKRLREDIEPHVPEGPMDSWLEKALASNPALKAREHGVLAANAAVREGKGGHYPSISFNLSAQRSDVGYDNTLAPRTDTYVATLGLQVPLFSGGSTSARVRALYGEQSAAEQEYEAVRRQIIKGTTSAYLSMQASVEKIRASRKALESAEQSTQAAERTLELGIGDAVDVLLSVQNEFKARRDLLKAQYDFVTSLLVLNRWAGHLSQQNIVHVNTWLASHEEVRALERKSQ